MAYNLLTIFAIAAQPSDRYQFHVPGLWGQKYGATGDSPGYQYQVTLDGSDKDYPAALVVDAITFCHSPLCSDTTMVC